MTVLYWPAPYFFLCTLCDLHGIEMIVYHSIDVEDVGRGPEVFIQYARCITRLEKINMTQTRVAKFDQCT